MLYLICNVPSNYTIPLYYYCQSTLLAFQLLLVLIFFHFISYLLLICLSLADSYIFDIVFDNTYFSFFFGLTLFDDHHQ